MRGQDVSSADMDVRKYLIRIAAELGDVLQDALAGIYVHGSLATGTFYRHASDLDLLVLVNRPLAPATLVALRQTLQTIEQAKPVNGPLEITILQQRYALSYEHPLKPELQWNSKPGAIASQLMHVKQRGVRLTGAQPQDAIGLIPWHAFIQSVMESFEAKAQRVADAPAAVVLNACRTLYDVSVPAVTIVDKIAAAEWALSRLPERFHELIRTAIEEQQTNGAHVFDRAAIEDLRAFVASAAEPAFAKVRDDDDDEDGD